MKISISKKEWIKKYSSVKVQGNTFMNHPNFRITEKDGTPTFTYTYYISFGDGAIGNSSPVVSSSINVNVFDWKDYSTVDFRKKLAEDLKERKRLLK